MMVFNQLKKYAPLLFLFVLISCNKTDWNENFKEKEKTPFGNYIIYNEASALFKDYEVTLLKENIYDYLLFDSDLDSTKIQNYVCIKHSGYKYSNEGVTELLDFVSKGNNVFLAFNHFKDTLQASLKFTTNNLDEKIFLVKDLKKLKGTFELNNDQFSKTSFTFDRNIRRNYFLQYNKNSTNVLGTIEVDGEKVPNFVKIHHGKGAFYLHTQPIAFTNYNLLNGRETYAANVFSYLPNAAILWDPHIKSSKYSEKKEDSTNVFKFFLEHQTLTWFLFVSLVGLLLFMIFNARRKQRPIPIIEPLKNSTVAFTQTIANLYLKEQDHKNLVDKKIGYFLEKVRSRYLLNTTNLNADFIEKLAAKSGNELQRTKYLINTIITLNKRTESSEEELVVLHKMIEKFLKN
ncbi:DUF4350 domain-containing protein [Polaribacter sp. Hel1_85]|uniref:DUF4350 domain-containing protein n=1 Tax=Polaribacter sp. Hel1_85 TaxID=1250005 RepID=UPI00052C7912|nr:DUF4350 domain-containing protein [Polaribacter sp. Hel1_85]KGL63486.1 hypothetical protein PHEL85_0522 [Polaribacter sp. Hel1_85]